MMAQYYGPQGSLGWPLIFDGGDTLWALTASEHEYNQNASRSSHFTKKLQPMIKMDRNKPWTHIVRYQAVPLGGGPVILCFSAHPSKMAPAGLHSIDHPGLMQDVQTRANAKVYVRAHAYYRTLYHIPPHPQKPTANGPPQLPFRFLE